MDSMMGLCDLIAENPAQLGEKLAWICGRCPPVETLGGSSPRVSVSRSQLNAILAVARFLSNALIIHTKRLNHSFSLFIVQFRRISTGPFGRNLLQTTQLNPFFVDFFEYICIACKLCPEFSVDVAKFTGDIMISAISNENEDLVIKKAILKAFCCNCPPVVPSAANKLVLGMLEQFQMFFPNSTESSFDSSSISGDSDKVVEEALDSIERREMALKFIGTVLDKSSIDVGLFENIRFVVQQQFRLMVAFLKKSMHDWLEQGQSLKVRINAELSAYQAAANLQTKILESLDLDGKSSKTLLRGALELLIGAAKACLHSAWRKLRACEELFISLLSGISRAAVARDGQMLEFLLVRFKPLVLDMCSVRHLGQQGGHVRKRVEDKL